MGRTLEEYGNEIQSHRAWLKSFHTGHAVKWETLLKANPEAAICEATTRDALQQHGISVEPNEDMAFGGPDFLCRQGENYFYTEVTCITKDAATDITGLSDKPQNKASCYSFLTKKIFGEICSKTPQCSNLGAPCAIAVGTLHFQAGCLCFDKVAAEELLTGTTFITASINRETGDLMREPYEATCLEAATFVRPIKKLPSLIEYARSPISTILLCALGRLPAKMVGVLHPNPNHTFDRDVLPRVEFCKLAEGYDRGPFKVEWI